MGACLFARLSSTPVTCCTMISTSSVSSTAYTRAQHCHVCQLAVQPQNAGRMRTCNSRCTNVTVSLSCGGLGRLATGTCRQQGGARHDAEALVSGRAAAGPVHTHMHGRHQHGVTCLEGASCDGVTYSARRRLCSAVSGMALMVLGCPQVGMSLRAAGHMPAASGCCGLCTKAADSTYARTCMRNRCIRSRRRSRAICTGGTQKYSAPGLAGILCWVHVAAAGRSRLRCTARLSEQEEGEVVGGGAHRQAVCCSP